MMNNIDLVSLFSVLALAQLHVCNSDEEATSNTNIKCLEGPHHLEYASPEPANFTECNSWRNYACCDYSVVEEIRQFKIETLYSGDSWDVCGPLTSECERYYINEECFYQCEPHISAFPHSETQGYVEDIPICGSYCKLWFDACRHDKICVENVLADYDWSTGRNQCPNGSSCITFEEMYGDARGLCDRMWGQAFYYVDDEAPGNNQKYCMVMQFNGDESNPNDPNHIRWSTSTAPVLHHRGVAWSYVLLLCIMIVQILATC